MDYTTRNLHSSKNNQSADLGAPGVQPILTRLAPCRCGCGGSDSWHKPTIKRAIRDAEVVTPVLAGIHLGWLVATGTAKMPWGMEPVEAHASDNNGKPGRYALWSLARLQR